MVGDGGAQLGGRAVSGDVVEASLNEDTREMGVKLSGGDDLSTVSPNPYSKHDSANIKLQNYAPRERKISPCAISSAPHR